MLVVLVVMEGGSNRLDCSIGVVGGGISVVFGGGVVAGSVVVDAVDRGVLSEGILLLVLLFLLG